jgi:hypothetical protein
MVLDPETFPGFKENYQEEIQDGDWDTAAEHVSFVNQGLC